MEIRMQRVITANTDDELNFCVTLDHIVFDFNAKQQQQSTGYVYFQSLIVKCSQGHLDIATANKFQNIITSDIA